MKTQPSRVFSSGAASVLSVTVRIGIFFDGTGNNRVNSQIGADCQAMSKIYKNAHIKECGGRHSDPTSSYSNDLTNIAKLADLYRHQPAASNDGDGLKVYHAIYISGAGTTSGRRDSVLSGQGFGRGNTGVVAKVSRCVKKIGDVLAAFKAHNPGCAIAALELDVFGFSRGAASARHLANEVLKKNSGALGAVLDPYKLPLASDFSWSNGSVRLKVIGLFDTVAAVGGFSDLGNVQDATNKRVNLFLPPGCAQQVLHLVAADEHRRNFALNSVTPHWTREIVMPGAHSDIGGGYPPQSTETVSLSKPRRSLVSVNTAYDTTDAWLQTHVDMVELDARRWIDPQDDTSSMGVECIERLGPSGQGMKNVVAAVVLKRRVFGHLSRVYLRIMHALACDEGVPFKPVTEAPGLMLPPELREITVKLLAHARDQDRPSPTLEQPVTSPLSKNELQMLYRRYIHCSAHWNGTLGKRGTLVDGLFVHAPATDGRLRFPNVSQPGYPH